MLNLDDVIGTWRAIRQAPFSSHTFIWERGPRRIAWHVTDAWLEDGVLLFRLDNGPGVVEFRLVSSDEAVVGAALAKLPAELSGPEYRRGIEGHRVRVTRDALA